ncbi:MAG: hypothetical protein ABJE95_04760 [Byssovorax sp.]
MTRHRPYPALLLSAALALGAAARPASAQPAPERAAQKAFDDGMKLLDQGKVAEACPKLEESQRLDPAMGTQYRLAECWEKLGRTASAWALFRQVVTEAQAAGRDDRAATSATRATALESRLARILIIVPPSASVPGLVVRRDGAIVEEGQWGRGVAVDPGEHLITATAPGKKPWEQAQQARSGTVEITIPVLETGTKPLAGTSGGQRADVVDPWANPGDAAPRRSLVPGLALGGVAVAGIGAGIALVVVANGKKADAATMRRTLAGVDCTITRPDCTALADTAGSAGNLSNAAFWTLLGSGLVAASAVTYFVWPASKAPPHPEAVLHVLPSVGAHGLGLSATGTF